MFCAKILKLLFLFIYLFNFFFNTIFIFFLQLQKSLYNAWENFRNVLQAENTYILTLDGDVEFYPNAVRLLVHKLKTNKKVGAACGRVHPVGSGKMLLSNHTVLV